MKRVLSLALATVLVISCLCLSACAETAVDSIDGKAPGEYLAELLDAEIDIERYDVVEGMRIRVNALFVSLYDTEIERLYVYSYDGANQSLIRPPEAVEKLLENEFDDIADDYNGDVRYVDGVCYIDGKNAKEKYESGASSIGKNGHIKTLLKLLEDQSESVICVETDTGRSFVLELTDPELMKMGVDCRREVYTVKVLSDGRIESITIDCTTDGIVTSTTSFTLRFVYEGLSPIEPPADADEYEET